MKSVVVVGGALGRLMSKGKVATIFPAPFDYMARVAAATPQWHTVIIDKTVSSAF